jgi:Fic family protein
MARSEAPPPFQLTPDDFPALARPDVSAFVQRANQSYWYWTELKRQPLPPGVGPQQAWSIVQLSRTPMRRQLSLAEGMTFQFKYAVTEPTLEKLHLFDLHLGGSLQGDGIIAPGERKGLLLSSIMEEAISSSQLEGAATTREIAKEMLRQGRKPRNESEQMIVNNFQAMQLLLDVRNEPLTSDLLLRFHAIITQETLDDRAKEGRFRQNNEVRVVDYTTSEVVYHPPSFAHLPDLLSAYYQLANDETPSGFIHPVVRASILHFLLGYLHPFADGNGRTARVVFYWYLMRKGYWLVEYLSISRLILKSAAQYARAYLHTEYDGNDLTYFINYQVRVLYQALESLKQHISRKVAEKRELLDLRRLTTLNDRQLELIREAVADPDRQFTISEVQQLFGVVFQTARTDLMGLEATGLLQSHRRGKKLLFFRASDFDAILARLRA